MKVLCTHLLIALALVVVARPLRAVDSQSQPFAGWDRKFTLQSADGRFTLNFGGRLQTYYEALRADPATDRVINGSTFSEKPLTEGTSLFRIRRARMVMDGNLYDPALRYEMQLELAGSSATLKRAYVNWKQNDALQFRAGRFKAPFGRQQLVSIFKQQLTERSLASNEFTQGDDDGVMVWGMPRHGVFEYYLGVFNGDGPNKNSQQDSRNQWFARAVWSPRGRFASSESSLGFSPAPQWSFGVNAGVNGGWLFDVNGKPGVQGPMQSCRNGTCIIDHGDDASIQSAGIDAAFTWNRFSSTGEWFERRIDPAQKSLRSVDANGWYVQTGWFVQPEKSEAGLRYGVVDFDTRIRNDSSREVSAFFNHYIHGHNYKIQTELTEIRKAATQHDSRAPAELRDHRVRVQLVLSF